MRLTRFTGQAIHGFRDFNVRFNKDLTFLTGINGSGKTTVLNAIIALITPSLNVLADLSYRLIRIDFDDNGKKLHIEARKDGNTVTIRASEANEELTFNKFLLEQSVVPPRGAEVEQEYYRELAAAQSQHPVLTFIAALPTPMFLGIDRRARFEDDLSRFRPRVSRQASRGYRNVFSAYLSQNLADAAGLAEDSYRDSLIAAGRIGDELRRDMLLRLLAVEPSRGFGPLSLPTKADTQEIARMRRDAAVLPTILSLPPEQVQGNILPFLELLESYIMKIPPSFDIEKAFGKKDSEGVLQAVINWSVNSPQLKRIKVISEIVTSYNSRFQSITEPTERYLRLLNQYLHDSGKAIRFDQNGYISYSLTGVEAAQPLYSLSSGEAQIFVILTHLSFNPAAERANVFIIDEPELSLHVQWQELFVNSALEANPRIQYIMATHSPSIILDKIGRCVDVGSKAPRQAGA